MSVTQRDTASPTEPSFASDGRLHRILGSLAWPLAIVLILQRLAVEAANGATTDDFTTVYSALRRSLNGTNVYEQIYHHTDPLYLYNPGATLVLSPLGLIEDASFARAIFIISNAAAIIIGLALLTRMFSYPLSHPLFPTVLAGAFATESVTNTLVFSNINGWLFLALCVFLYLHTTPSTKRGWAAGVVLGLAILIKPQFAPLIFLPLVKKQKEALIASIGVPIVINLLAWPIIPGSNNYLTDLVPHLRETRDYANSSLAGFAEYFAMPGWLYFLLWLLFAAAVGITVLLLLQWRDDDPLWWAATTAGVLLCGVFFLSSLGQMYYSMMLFPLLFTALRPRSVFHVWPAWLAAVLFLAPVTWYSDYAENAGRWISYFSNTAGWALLLLTAAVASVVWTLQRPDRRRPKKRTRVPKKVSDASRIDE